MSLLRRQAKSANYQVVWERRDLLHSADGYVGDTFVFTLLQKGLVNLACGL